MTKKEINKKKKSSRGNAKSQYKKKVKGLILLKKNKMKQEDISKLLGISLSAVKKWSIALNASDSYLADYMTKDPKRGPSKKNS